MGRTGWIGLVVLSCGVAAVVQGLGRGHAPTHGRVTLDAPTVLHAILSSFGLIACLFGIVLLVFRNEPVRAISWGRGAAPWLAMTVFAYFALQGPEIAASASGRDRASASAAHDDAPLHDARRLHATREGLIPPRGEFASLADGAWPSDV